MKISVVILMVVGIIAAIAAAVLVGLLRAEHQNSLSGGSGKSPDVEVLVAKHDLPAMAKIDEDAVEAKTMPRDHAPANAISDPSNAIGKVLIVPLDKGQAVTASSFAAPGTGVTLAYTLKPGMRAAAVNVSDAAGLYGILYPGCAVDVLVAIKRSHSDEAPDTISTTLLENIPVLGVDQETVVAPATADKKDDPNAQSRMRKITLMVDVQQAKALQLAQDVGVLSLALRNPTDKEKNPDAKPFSIREISGMENSIAGTPVTPAPTQPAEAINPVTPVATHPVETAPAPRNEIWGVTVIHGNTVETKEFKVPAN